MSNFIISTFSFIFLISSYLPSYSSDGADGGLLPASSTTSPEKKCPRRENPGSRKPLELLLFNSAADNSPADGKRNALSVERFQEGGLFNPIRVSEDAAPSSPGISSTNGTSSSGFSSVRRHFAQTTLDGSPYVSPPVKRKNLSGSKNVSLAMRIPNEWYISEGGHWTLQLRKGTYDYATIVGSELLFGSGNSMIKYSIGGVAAGKKLAEDLLKQQRLAAHNAH